METKPFVPSAACALEYFNKLTVANASIALLRKQLASAELLIIREAHAPAASAGEPVSCIALDMFHSVF